MLTIFFITLIGLDQSPYHLIEDDDDGYEPYYPGIDDINFHFKGSHVGLSHVSIQRFFFFFLNVILALSGCRNVDCYTYVDRVDEGQYGVVYKAKDNLTQELVCACFVDVLV